ncbi:aminotransferase class I/II-fold pyridoxal phosphate-dependent enzyme [Dehalogenimonas etheniformans]|uniref:Aminotransferase n=1 Tax=Dehalogenimonas etheniformans TaxID=1536648 RepID=A0A2P5PA03_9CHLR|nr:aminotransferase class I/II-fold pyridoxal phosphate-dependent enzyme [Dehalogenimonas etheniformans]PPD59122.1 aminotransferase class V-fold PLP-dependent enzyme [Dehalogenimonas etheniformans]QNT75834.1 aminotransferase class I/II-fold pyridoxal phosphate-dependent enzyme [Dehalogenimonas etheniformans]
MPTETSVKRSMTSKAVKAIKPSGIRKFFDLLADMEGAISLGVGEPDYVTPWHIREAAIYALEHGRTMYTSNAGTPELRQEIARYLNTAHGLEYNPLGEIVVTVGVSEALDLAARAILDPGDEVIIPDPCYVSYPSCVTLAGGVPVTVPTWESESFELNPREVARAITPRTRAILLGYPANPTGAVMPYDKLAELAILAARHNLIVLSDEIYNRLTYGVTVPSFASLPGMRERTVVLNGVSKAYSMTGWRIGYAAGPKEIIAGMTKIHQYTMLCASSMGQAAAIEALKNGESDIQAMVEDYNHRRQVMVSGFNSLGLSCFDPRGAFYAFPSIKSTGLSSDEFAERLLKEEKVAVVPGTAFGEQGEGYLRCCYATSLPQIEEALERVKRFLTRL